MDANGGTVNLMEYGTINVIIDGWQIYFGDRPPVITEGRVMVPVRTTFESLGFFVDWFPDDGRILVQNHMHVVNLFIDSPVFFLNGVERFMDIPIQIINDTAMMPLRTVFRRNWV